MAKTPSEIRVAIVPAGEMHGEGTVRYRCASCLEMVDDPIYSDGHWVADIPRELDTNPNVRTYHREHAPALEVVR